MKLSGIVNFQLDIAKNVGLNWLRRDSLKKGKM